MTEEEWRVSADPQVMLEFLRGLASDRKLRLFACVCFRRICHVIMNSPRAVDFGERFADDQASLAEWRLHFETPEITVARRQGPGYVERGVSIR